jgi:hypothetical protein
MVIDLENGKRIPIRGLDFRKKTKEFISKKNFRVYFEIQSRHPELRRTFDDSKVVRMLTLRQHSTLGLPDESATIRINAH